MAKFKSCPKCSRTYSDLTLSFCLEDGSLLSAPFEDNENSNKPINNGFVNLSQSKTFDDRTLEFEPEIKTLIRPTKPISGKAHTFIAEAVSRNPLLSLKLTADGNHHRIMKSGWNGSVWIVKTRKGYKVETTGDISTNLNREITNLYGQNDGENKKGYKYWFIANSKVVEKIIDVYGQS